ncbi:MAG: hypothetical protein ACRCXB_27955 [Aeromonadaceae bacterium]
MLSEINLIVISCATIFVIVLAMQKLIGVVNGRSKREAYEKKFNQMQHWRVIGNMQLDMLRAANYGNGVVIEGEYEKLD